MYIDTNTYLKNLPPLAEPQKLKATGLPATCNAI